MTDGLNAVSASDAKPLVVGSSVGIESWELGAMVCNRTKRQGVVMYSILTATNIMSKVENVEVRFASLVLALSLLALRCPSLVCVLMVQRLLPSKQGANCEAAWLEHELLSTYCF